MGVRLASSGGWGNATVIKQIKQMVTSINHNPGPDLQVRPLDRAYECFWGIKKVCRIWIQARAFPNVDYEKEPLVSS